MAMYTIGIADKLLEAANGQDITDPEVLLNVSRETLFGSELNVIDEKYRDRFVLGFAQEFINDEIGLETWTGFRLALSHRVYDSAEYINQIFSQLDKQVFSNYHVRESESTGKRDGTTNGETKGNDTTSSSSTVTGTNDNTVDTTESGTGSSNSKHTGSDSVANTGTVTTQNDTSGTSSSTTETLTHFDGAIVSETTANNTGKVYRQENVQQATKGTVGTDTNLTTTGTNTESKTSDGWTGVSDIPENGITDPSTLTDKDGLTYLSSATLDHAKDSSSGSTSQKVTGSADDNKQITDSTVTTSADRDSNYTENDLTVKSNSKVTNPDQKITGSASSEHSESADTTQTLNTKATTTYGGITDDTTSSERTGKQTAKGTSSSTTEGNTTGNTTSTTSGTSSETSSGTAKEQSYDLSYEMLMRSQPLMKKIWNCFTDLFCMLWN